MATKRQATTRKERENQKKKRKAAKAQRIYKASPKGKQYQPKKRLVKNLSPQNHAKQLEQGRARKRRYDAKQKTNSKAERAKLLKIVPVTEVETKLDPKLQACLDDVITGVERLRVKSTEPTYEWIEQTVYDEEAWKQSKPLYGRCS